MKTIHLISRRISGNFPYFALFSALSLCPVAFAVPAPIAELKLDEGTGTTTTVTGTTGCVGTLTAARPVWTTNAPVNGTNALDFYSPPNFGSFAVDVNNATTLNALKGLKSFTITGWINRRGIVVGPGGNRIVAWNNGKLGGVELALQADKSLKLGVNELNDATFTPNSSSDKIPDDMLASYNNWRFFAVTYDGTLTSNNVNFYFGTNFSQASLDVTRTYNKGTTSANIGPQLAIGHLTTAVDPDITPATSMRDSHQSCIFRGLIDQIRVYGSQTGNSGVLSLADIITIQNINSTTSNSGILYEQWDNISGSLVTALTSSPNFPANPSATLILPTFDAFLNRADNFGVRMSGWVQAPATGNYLFWIAADDNAELRISADANPMNKRLIAQITGDGMAWTAPYEWAKSGLPAPSKQQSDPVALVAGQYYYIEALMKENSGGDHLSVGWQLPNGTQERPIPVGRLFTSPPDAAGFLPSTLNLYEPGTSKKKVTLGWNKAPGNDNFSINVDGVNNLQIHNNEVTVPRLFYGSTTDENKLGFFEQYSPRRLVLGRPQGGSHSLNALSIYNEYPNSSPYAVFNEKFQVEGPNFNDGNGTSWGGTANMSNFYGLIQFRNRASPAAQYVETSQLTANELYLYQDATVGGVTVNSSSTLSSTSLETDTVKARYVVTTPKWKVVPDYVFEKGYKLRTLPEIERMVRQKKHLPNMPSAKEIGEKGMDLTEMNLKLLKTVEELTLHVIDLNKQVQALKENKIQGKISKERN